MSPTPIALSLVLCEKVIVEDKTKNHSLINTFTKLRVPQFPSPLQQFAVYTALTDGFGEGIMDLVVTLVEMDEVIYSYRNRLRFPDRLMEVQALIHVSKCSYPVAGQYLFTLLIDGVWVAHRRLEVVLKEAQP